MAKLKYDRPINIVLSSGKKAEVPAGEVWAVAFGMGSNLENGTTVRGGVLVRTLRQRNHYRHRFQTHRRVNGSMEVVLHG